MIENAAFLSRLQRDRLNQVGRFMVARGASSSGIIISPSPSLQDEGLISIVYSKSPEVSSEPDCHVSFETNFGRAEFSTKLFDSLRLTVLLVDAPDWRERMKGLSLELSTEKALALMDLDPDQVLKPSVKSYLPGEYIAPDGTNYCSFSVEDRGEVIRTAVAKDLTVVAFQFAAMRAYESKRLGNVIAQFASSNVEPA